MIIDIPITQRYDYQISMGKVLLGFSVLLALFYIITPSPKTLAQTKITSTPTSPDALEEQRQNNKEEVAASTKSSGDSMEATQSSLRLDSGQAEVKEEYSLPYPGILPDNPLHFLKALRDKIILLLISDPVKEAEFNLLTSDKRIYAAQLLADHGKDELSFSTLSKSNNYFNNAVSSAAEAKKMGKDIDTVLHNMKKSIVKHQEVLFSMEKVLSKAFVNQLQIEERRMLDFEKSVDNFLLK